MLNASSPVRQTDPELLVDLRDYSVRQLHPLALSIIPYELTVKTAEIKCCRYALP